MDINESTSSNSSNHDSDIDNESAFEEDDTGSDYVPSDDVSCSSEGEDSQTSASKSLNKKKENLIQHP